jgi:hypothetical protein
MQNSNAFPTALEPLVEDYSLIDEVLATLPDAAEEAVRADLAEQLIRAAAPAEDAKEQVLWPFLEDHGHGREAEALRASAHRVGEAMLEIDRAVRHSVPLDVHKSDPEGVERDIAALVGALKRHRELESTTLFPFLRGLPDDEAKSLADALQRARARGLDHPLPPHNPVLRWLARIEERLDRVADTSEKYRPGQERIEPSH